MELVIVNHGVPTTTTLAIAEGTGNEHKAVIQLVRNYLSDLEQFGRVTFEMAPFETSGGTQTREIASLNERQATLIMSYMKNTTIIRTFKIQLTKKFYEMAKQVKTAHMIPQTFSEALRLAADLEERNAILAPKAAIADRLVSSEDAVNLTVAAKTFGVPPQKFIKELNRLSWIYKRPGSTHWLGYQDKINAGYLDQKYYQYTKDDGSEGSKPQVLVLPKGMAKLTTIYGQPELFN